MTTSMTSPRFDHIEHHPDNAVTAYTYFPPGEAIAGQPLPELA